MNILTAGFFAAAFTACTDDVENEAMAVNSGPNTRSFELTSLEQYSYSVPVKVDVEGDWEIDLQFSDENNHFCYALPNKGHGPQTIKLCMLDNWTEKRNEGEMIIRDLSKVYYTRYATFLTDTRKPVGGWHVATTKEFENLKANVTYEMGGKAQTMDSGKLTSDPDKGREAMQIRLVMDM